MIVMAAGVDFKLAGEVFSTRSPRSPSMRERMAGPAPEICELEPLSRPAGKLRRAKSSPSGALQAMPEELQELLCKKFFADPTRWWDNRRSKPTSRHPDFKQEPGSALWLKTPASVESQLATLDAGTKATDESGTSSVQGHGAFAADEGHLEVRMCGKLCEDGRISDAVNVLDILVQRGCGVPKNLFYRVLKKCIQDKDLVLGRRIHALIVKSGSEGHAFLATHLISLYSSHGRLDEAMHVFTKIPTPDAYNWATIIFAFARPGDAAEAAVAIRLYRQMRQATTVQPDDRIYSAVLKACAAAGDLVAGKEVHTHILASPSKPDRFVQAGLINMYAKCGSLEDARRIFEKLSNRDVVTWTAMIAGYAQQGMGLEALSIYRSMEQEGLTPPNSVTYVCVLQACTSVGLEGLSEGKQVHAQIKERGLQEDGVLGVSLVNMYAKCGSLVDARKLFDKLPKRNLAAWNAMIGGYVQQGLGQEALSLCRNIQQDGLTPDCVTYVCLLQACASVGVGALDEGRHLHAQIKEQGLEEVGAQGVTLVNMYAKCGSLADAQELFQKLPERNVVAWNALMAGYAQQGMGQEAFRLHRSMQREGLTPPNSVTYVCLLQACANIGIEARDVGKQLHADIRERGLQEDMVLGGSLVNMYSKCGCLEDARVVFDRLLDRDIVTWTVMIAGYAHHGMGQEALSIYRNMQQEGLTPPDCVTYVCLLQACAILGVEALDEGKQLHVQIRERGLQEDVILGGSLVNMYAKCGSLEDARSVFDKLPEKNVIAWTAMLARYAQQGMGQEALCLYRSMQKEGLSIPDSVAYVCLLQACASVGVKGLDEGQLLHKQIEDQGLQQDVVLGGSLVNMYVKCGTLEAARRVFDELPERNVIAWTAMLAGYVQQGMGQKALSLYSSMQEEGLTPSSVTYVCLLQACATVGVEALAQGKQVHAQIEERRLQEDVALGGSLINMYAKCGSLEDARIVFDKLSDKDVVTWTAMIAGYGQQGMGQEALSLYRSMQLDGLTPPNSVTYVCLLQACAAIAALPLGEELHAQIQDQGLQADPGIGAAVVNMYAKCGSMFHSQQVFDSLCERTLEAWNALITGYTRQGNRDVVFSLLDRMRLEGIQPNDITFLSVLTVCSHGGLVDKGLGYFEAMTIDYGITATLEHFICMVDLLGRAGHLDEALQMAKTMPFPPSDVVWHTLLGACRKWKNVEIGQQAFEGAVRLDEKDAASYVLMSNIYASAHMWEASKEMQARRTKLGAWKKPGQSWWTDMGGVVHTFLAGDNKHLEIEGIYARLNN